jgi:hypothetical protein
MTTILTKKKDTTGAPAPGDLTNSAGGAELAVNTFDKRLYTKDSGGNIVEIGTNPSTIDTTTVDTTNLEVTNIKAKDGTASATIANSTGVMTVASSVLTTTDINGGTVDGAVIGGATPAAATFTTATATTGNITTVNATTVDATNVEVTNLKAKDGTASATIADATGVMTIASAVLTTADINGGTIDGATIGGSSAAAVSSTNLSYTGTLTGGTGVVNLGSGQFYKDASGNVGIGTSSPTAGYKLDVNGNLRVAGTTTELGFGTYPVARVNGTANNAIFGFALDGTQGGAYNGRDWRIEQGRTAAGQFNITDISGSNTVRLSINANGAVGLSGANAAASGVGITFPATQSASSDANTLDDYEEGTFSPTISGWSGTYTTQKGFYTKVGRLVTLIGQVSTVASSGTFTAFPGPANYPFAAGGYAGSYYNGTWAVVSGAQALPTGWLTAGPLDGPMNGNTSSFPNVFVANALVSNWTNAQCNPAVIFEIRFQVTYFT